MFRYIFTTDNIEGECTLKDYEKGIEIESFQMGFKAPHKRHEIVELSKSDYWPGIVCKDIVLRKKYDKSLPTLLMALTTGQKIEKGTIYSFDRQNKVYLTTELEGIMVRRTAIHLDKEDILASVTLDYEVVVQTYTPEAKKSAGLFEFTKIEDKREPGEPKTYKYEPPKPKEPEPCKQDMALEVAADEGNPFVQDCERKWAEQ